MLDKQKSALTFLYGAEKRFKIMQIFEMRTFEQIFRKHRIHKPAGRLIRFLVNIRIIDFIGGFSQAF